jgi:hypothetical protein
MKPVNQQRHAYVADKTLAVLAVKESPKAAIEAAQRMGRRRRERLFVWSGNLRLRPGAILPVDQVLCVSG